MRKDEKLTERWETPVKPVGRREKNVDISHSFEQKRGELTERFEQKVPIIR